MKPAAESVALRAPSPWQRLWGNAVSRLCLLAILLYTLAALWGEGVYRYYRGTLLPGCPALTWAPERQAPCPSPSQPGRPPPARKLITVSPMNSASAWLMA